MHIGIYMFISTFIYKSVDVYGHLSMRVDLMILMVHVTLYMFYVFILKMNFLFVMLMGL